MLLERFLLPGQVAIVTGASSGVGRAIAEVLAEAGATVVMAGRRATELFAAADALKGLGREAIAVPTDMIHGSQIDALVRRAMADTGRLDIVVNVVGGAPLELAGRVSDDELEAAFHLNVTSAFHLARASSRHLRASGGGSIVNISHVSGHQVDIGHLTYGTVKAALEHMTRLLAVEWAPTIRVNAVAAGPTRTAELEPLLAVDGVEQAVAGQIPMGRWAEPNDVALATLFLASAASSHITGQVLSVHGGADRFAWPMPPTAPGQGG